MPEIGREFEVPTTGFQCVRLMLQTWREVKPIRHSRASESIAWMLQPGKYWLIRYPLPKDALFRVHVSEISVNPKNIAIIHIPPYMYPSELRKFIELQ